MAKSGFQSAFGAVESSANRDKNNFVVHAEMQIGDSLLMLGQGRAELESASGGVDSGALSIMVLLQTDSRYI